MIVVAPQRDNVDVLVTHAWGRVPYNVVRSLGKHGLKVVVGTDRFLGMAVFSRYASAAFRHPFVVRETDGFVKAVKDALKQYSPKVYFPMNEDVFVAARHIQEFRDTGVVTPIAPFETVKKLHKKDEVLSLAKSIGIPIPETIVPQTEGDIRHFYKEFGPHVVLKRTSSSGARGVFYLTENQIIRSWNGDRPVDRCPSSGFVLQRCVNGVGHGVSMLFRNGALRAKFTHKRLREKGATGGMSTLRVGVVNRVLEEYAQRLLESVRFHGVAMVEFRHDELSGQSWLLEVNPRFWGSVALAIQSGVDFPYLLYRLATEGDVAPVEAYRTGLVVKWILGDIGAARRRPRSVDSDEPSPTHIRTQGYDDFYWDEPLPFLAGAVLSVWKFLGTRTWTPDQVDLNIEQLVH